VNIPRFVLSVILCFAFVLVFEAFWHGYFLQEAYQATAELWRGPEAMKEFFVYGLISQFLFSLLLAWLFTLKAENKGLPEGLRFGLYFGLFVGIMQFGIYPYLPIPLSLAAMWFLGSLIEGLGLGIVLGLSYKPKNS
jgi:predicted cobalt transporter CbtA